MQKDKYDYQHHARSADIAIIETHTSLNYSQILSCFYIFQLEQYV